MENVKRNTAAEQKSHPLGWLFCLYKGYEKDIFGELPLGFELQRGDL